jgi:uncharacterized membrane protein
MSHVMKQRITSIDAVRGAVMIIMALDHVRDFVHRGAMIGSPTNLATTTPILFFTRWITHFCAPTFMFAAGLGAWFWYQNSRTKAELSRFLLTRGLWLVFLELTVMHVAMFFRISSEDPILLEVMWALGMSMIALAALIWLPFPVLAAVSIATIALHNLFASPVGSPIGKILHQPGFFQFSGHAVLLAYPLIPWIAVMALGFCFGRIFRERVLLWTGIGATLAFIAIRAINRYGDPFPWSAKKWSLLSFLNATKYPPSLDFLLMTLGPALIAFALLKLSPTNPVVVFGRVPMFFFIVHFYLAHVIMVVLSRLVYGSAGFMFQPEPSITGPANHFPPGFGFDLWVVYVVWIAVILISYPLCRWFAEVKSRRRDWWLSYL